MITENFRYISLDDAIAIHQKTIEHSGGGSHILLNPGQLESILEHIKDDRYYPTFPQKLTHLFFGVCKFHCFTDGNKRLAITLSTQFLLINGFLYVAQTFIRETENISYHVAANHIDKKFLEEILTAIISYNFENNEPLKLRLAIAESREDKFYQGK